MIRIEKVQDIGPKCFEESLTYRVNSNSSHCVVSPGLLEGTSLAPGVCFSGEGHHIGVGTISSIVVVASSNTDKLVVDDGSTGSNSRIGEGFSCLPFGSFLILQCLGGGQEPPPRAARHDDDLFSILKVNYSASMTIASSVE